jgi:hypothetical protein
MLTLKKIQHSAFNSQETHCYMAKLYFGTKLIAMVGNEGHGGCDYQHIEDEAGWKAAQSYVAFLNKPEDKTELAKEIRRRIISLVRIGDDGFSKNDTQHSDAVLLVSFQHVLDIDWLNHDIESVCNRLLEDHIVQKELRKLMSKRVVFTRNDKTGIYQTNCAPNARVRDAWVKQMAQKPYISVILNNESIEVATKIFQRGA